MSYTQYSQYGGNPYNEGPEAEAGAAGQGYGNGQGVCTQSSATTPQTEAQSH